MTYVFDMLFLESFAKRGSLLTEAYKYSCVMAMVPKEVCPIFTHFQKLIDPSDLDPNEEKQLEDEFHVTVLYGLVDNRPDMVRSLFKDQHSFLIELRGCTLFENEGDVLKVDIHSEELEKMNKLLKDNCKNEDKYPDYHPHLTIAYLKKGAGKKYISNSFDGVSLPISKLIFSNPEGEKIPIVLRGKDLQD